MLSAIIINFRSSHLINDCVRALLEGTRAPDEVVIVDNEGTDGGLDTHLATDSRVRVEVVHDNPGYSTSCQRGAGLAGGDVLLFMNPDVLVSPACVASCLGTLGSDAGIGIVTPRLMRPDGTLDHACHRGIPDVSASLAYKSGLSRLFPSSHRLGRYTMSWLDTSTDHDVEACSGAFMLMARSDLEAIGGWDEGFTFYGEDLDLCLRMGAHGRRTRYLGTITAAHEKSAFSHQGTPDAQLDADQLRVKRRIKREILASHRRFHELHIRPTASWPANLAIESMFAVQSLRLRVVERRARS